MADIEEDSIVQASTSRDGINGAGDKSTEKPRRGGGNRQDAPPTVQLSKALSYILRHGAAKEGLKLRADGYIPLDAVLARPRVSKMKMENGSSPTKDDVLQIVNSNDKKRFETSNDENGGILIRAVQGHSIAEVTELDHVPLTLSNLSILAANDGLESLSIDEEPRLPDGVEILHGTNKDAWDKIKTSGGLSRMKRNHIHLAKGRPSSDSVISGMRKTSAIIISVDIIAALKDGIPFALASNGAVLTSGIGDSGVLPLQYVKCVEESKTGKIIWTPTTS